MKTPYGHTVAENAIILAENDYYCVWKYGDVFYLSGFVGTRLFFADETSWNDLASVIIEATKKIKEGVKV